MRRSSVFQCCLLSGCQRRQKEAGHKYSSIPSVLAFCIDAAQHIRFSVRSTICWNYFLRAVFHGCLQLLLLRRAPCNRMSEGALSGTKKKKSFKALKNKKPTENVEGFVVCFADEYHIRCADMLQH